MKRHVKALWAAVIVLVLAGTMTAAAIAQNRRLPAQRGLLAQNAQLRPNAWLAGLKLSQEQKDQVKSILAGHKEEMKNLAQTAAAARKELAAAIADGADAQALKASYDKVAAAGWERILLDAKIQGQIKGILTPEQLQQLEKRKQLRRNAVRNRIKK